MSGGFFKRLNVVLPYDQWILHQGIHQREIGHIFTQKLVHENW